MKFHFILWSLTLLVILSDFFTPLGFAGGTLYVLPILWCHRSRNANTVIHTAGLHVFLIWAVYLLLVTNHQIAKIILANRIISTVIILVISHYVYSLVRYQNKVVDIIEDTTTEEPIDEAIKNLRKSKFYQIPRDL